MKIFVTGAAGFIGRGTMKAGRERGHEMIGCDIRVPDGSDVRIGNITDLDFLIRESTGCDAIIHLASLHTGHLEKGTSRTDFYQVNVGGSDNIYQATLRNGIGRVVFASSLDIHCGTHAAWAYSGAVKYTSQTPDLPNSFYALTKEMVEKMGHFYYRTQGIRVCSLRYVYIHGSIDKPHKLNPYSLISRVLLVEDCAEANLLACESDRVYDDVLLLGPGSPLTNEDLVHSITDPDSVVETYWPGSIADFQAAGFSTGGELWPSCDITRAHQVLGWQPRYSYDWLWQQVKNGLKRPPTRS